MGLKQVERGSRWALRTSAVCALWIARLCDRPKRWPPAKILSDRNNSNNNNNININNNNDEEEIKEDVWERNYEILHASSEIEEKRWIMKIEKCTIK